MSLRQLYWDRHIVTPSQEAAYSKDITYNINNGLKKWRAALAKLKSKQSGIINLNFIGDSNTEGYGSDDLAPNTFAYGYPGRIRTKLASLYGDVGAGFLAPATPYASPFWVLGTGWQLNTAYGWGVCKTCMVTSTLDSIMTLNFTGTGINLFYGRGSGCCKFTWKIDSGSETTVDAHGDGAIMTLSISGLSSMSHTLTIKNIAHTSYPAATSQFFFGGYPVNDAVSGIRVNNLAKYGNPASSFVFNTIFSTSNIAALLPPTLTIIATIGIDAASGTPLASYKDSLQSMITSAKVSGDVLLLNNAIMPGVSNQTAAIYGGVMRELAKENDIAYVSYVARVGSNSDTATRGLIRSDDLVHLTKTGAQDLATFLLNILLEER